MRSFPTYSLLDLEALAPSGLKLTANLIDGQDYTPPEAEAASLKRARPARWAQFCAGRLAATRAASKLGAAPWPALPRDSYGAPQWPANLVGSIAHSSTLATAIVGHRSQYARLGLDCEPLDPTSALESTVISNICSARELEQKTDPIATFCAKEAIYKALAPHDGPAARALEFLDVEVSWTNDLFHAIPVTAKATSLLALPALSGRMCRVQHLDDSTPRSDTPAHLCAVVWLTVANCRA